MCHSTDASASPQLIDGSVSSVVRKRLPKTKPRKKLRETSGTVFGIRPRVQDAIELKARGVSGKVLAAWLRDAVSEKLVREKSEAAT